MRRQQRNFTNFIDQADNKDKYRQATPGDQRSHRVFQSGYPEDADNRQAGGGNRWGQMSERSEGGESYMRGNDTMDYSANDSSSQRFDLRGSDRSSGNARAGQYRDYRRPGQQIDAARNSGGAGNDGMFNSEEYGRGRSSQSVYGQQYGDMRSSDSQDNRGHYGGGSDRDTQYGDDQRRNRQYGTDQYSSNQSNQGRDSQNQYNQGQYNQGQSNQGQYSQGQSNQGQYNQGRVNQGQYNQDHYNQGQNSQSQYGQTQYGQGQYGQNQASQGQSNKDRGQGDDGYGDRSGGYGTPSSQQPFFGQGVYGEQTQGGLGYGQKGYGQQGYGQQGYGQQGSLGQQSGYVERQGLRDRDVSQYPAQSDSSSRSQNDQTQSDRASTPYSKSIWGNRTDASSGQRSGRSRGSLPKGYKKSDQRLTEDLGELLANEGIDCSNLDIEVKEGVVKLSGEVSDRFDKFTVEQLASDMSGVVDVENQLRLANKNKADWNKSDLGKSESGKPDSGKSDSTKSESVKSDSTKSDSFKHDSIRNETTNPADLPGSSSFASGNASRAGSTALGSKSSDTSNPDASPYGSSRSASTAKK